MVMRGMTIKMSVESEILLYGMVIIIFVGIYTAMFYIFLKMSKQKIPYPHDLEYLGDRLYEVAERMNGQYGWARKPEGYDERNP